MTRNRPGFFVALVLLGAVAGAVDAARTKGIFACPTADLGPDHYLAYCQATGFGDYDHGAFWFDLEEEAISAAASAEVLFLGNSRLQFGLSSELLEDWFASQSLRYYLLGFSHMENHNFTRPLLSRLNPTADAYIVNIDLFFESRVSPPANDVMTDDGSFERYRKKRVWQRIHDGLCGAIESLCRNEVAFFRSRTTGAWVRKGGEFGDLEKVVTYDDSVDQSMLDNYYSAGAAFISELTAGGACIILTNTPQSNTTSGTARSLADRLGLPLVAPRLDGLKTFDGSHLDVDSARRWSAAFVESAAPLLRACVGRADS